VGDILIRSFPLGELPCNFSLEEEDDEDLKSNDADLSEGPKAANHTLIKSSHVVTFESRTALLNRPRPYPPGARGLWLCRQSNALIQ
jgi:hypothetical protein